MGTKLSGLSLHNPIQPSSQTGTGTYEVFSCVRIGESLIPVSADLTGSEAEFTSNIPSGQGVVG